MLRLLMNAGLSLLPPAILLNPVQPTKEEEILDDILLGLQKGDNLSNKTIDCSLKLVNPGKIAYLMVKTQKQESITIDLASCSINDQDLVCIIEAIKKGTYPSKMTLNLSRNNITNRGANALFEALQYIYKPGLTLRLNHNNITETFFLMTILSRRSYPGLTITLIDNPLIYDEIMRTYIENSYQLSPSIKIQLPPKRQRNNKCQVSPPTANLFKLFPYIFINNGNAKNLEQANISFLSFDLLNHIMSFTTGQNDNSESFNQLLLFINHLNQTYPLINSTTIIQKPRVITSAICPVPRPIIDSSWKDIKIPPNQPAIQPNSLVCPAIYTSKNTSAKDDFQCMTNDGQISTVRDFEPTTKKINREPGQSKVRFFQDQPRALGQYTAPSTKLIKRVGNRAFFQDAPLSYCLKLPAEPMSAILPVEPISDRQPGKSRSKCSIS